MKENQTYGKLWQREVTARDPKETTSYVKDGGESIMVWACMAADGLGALVFTDDVRSS